MGSKISQIQRRLPKPTDLLVAAGIDSAGNRINVTFTVQELINLVQSSGPGTQLPEPTVYDTVLEFTSATTDSKESVTGSVPAVSSVVKLYFNKIEGGATGFPMSPGTTIYYNNVLVMITDQLQDYKGQWFKLVAPDGTEKAFICTNGEVYL